MLGPEIAPKRLLVYPGFLSEVGPQDSSTSTKIALEAWAVRGTNNNAKNPIKVSNNALLAFENISGLHVSAYD